MFGSHFSAWFAFHCVLLYCMTCTSEHVILGGDIGSATSSKADSGHVGHAEASRVCLHSKPGL
eukprot:4934769-Amphidinium_carterae.1